jgi:hypothetical protein
VCSVDRSQNIGTNHKPLNTKSSGQYLHLRDINLRALYNRDLDAGMIGWACDWNGVQTGFRWGNLLGNIMLQGPRSCYEDNIKRDHRNIRCVHKRLQCQTFALTLLNLWVLLTDTQFVC